MKNRQISSTKCPHLPADEQAGDESGWCVVCLRNKQKELKRQIANLKKEVTHWTLETLAMDALVKNIAEKQREACAEAVGKIETDYDHVCVEDPETVCRATPLVLSPASLKRAKKGQVIKL